MSSPTATNWARNATSLLSRLSYPCPWCMHGGKCRYIVTELSEQSCLCPKGYDGKRCQDIEIHFQHGEQKLQDPKVVAGIVIAGFVLMIIAVMGVLKWRRFRKIKQNNNRRLSLRESFQKKTSIEGVSIGDEKAFQNSLLQGNKKASKHHAKQDKKKASNGEIFAISATTEKRQSLPGELGRSMSLEKWPPRCYVNPIAGTKDENSNCR